MEVAAVAAAVAAGMMALVRREEPAAVAACMAGSYSLVAAVAVAVVAAGTVVEVVGVVVAAAVAGAVVAAAVAVAAGRDAAGRMATVAEVPWQSQQVGPSSVLGLVAAAAVAAAATAAVAAYTWRVAVVGTGWWASAVGLRPWDPCRTAPCIRRRPSTHSLTFELKRLCSYTREFVVSYRPLWRACGVCVGESRRHQTRAQ